MIITKIYPHVAKPQLFLSILLIIAVALTDSKATTAAVSVPKLRRWQSTGIVNCTDDFVFTCKDSTDILPLHKRCDGIAQCTDKSDEQKCTECRTPFSVNGTDGFLECISSNSMRREHDEARGNERKDGGLYQKCETSEREKQRRSWEVRCADGEHRCFFGNKPLCLPSSSICDGVEDCQPSDNEAYFRWLYGSSRMDSEERDCKECKNGAKMCKRSGECIPFASLCDGRKDCLDGSDEQDCTCATCNREGRALCGSGECIEENKVCNGVIDCQDASDERDCPTSCGAKVTNSTILPEIVTCYHSPNGPSRTQYYLKSEICSGRDHKIPEQCRWGVHCTLEKCDCRFGFFCQRREAEAHKRYTDSMSRKK